MSTSLPDDYLYKADQLFGRLGLWMYNHKLVVFLAALLLLGAGLYFAATARTDNSFDTFFDASDPAYSAYMTYQDEFGSDEVAYILYSVPRSEHGPFELEAMQRIAQLTEALEYEVPFVKDVTSLSNVEFITADEDFLQIHELALDMPHDQDTLLERRGALPGQPGQRRSNPRGDHPGNDRDQQRFNGRPAPGPGGRGRPRQSVPAGIQQQDSRDTQTPGIPGYKISLVR
jgi:hypothetical protein